MSRESGRVGKPLRGLPLAAFFCDERPAVSLHPVACWGDEEYVRQGPRDYYYEGEGHKAFRNNHHN